MNNKPELFFYNTMSRQKELFRPVAGDTARMYSCGPTVYSTAHIGNLRAYIFMDTLRRVLKRNGYKLMHVMNITDVGHLVSDEDDGEDKMVKGARERNKTPWEIADEFTRQFMEDIAALNIETPEIVSKATEHIPQMIGIIEGLVEKGYGYILSDGVYYDIARFGGYGKLSRLSLDDQLAGARVGVNPEKRNPADFALWIRAPKEHIMKWESPWGTGYPGWHIECSAMSMHYLGDRIDIHTGGVDHIPVHHENEIAQSDAYAGHRVVNTWMHNEFILVDGGKMSKSLKNDYTIADLRARGFNPLAYRYFCLNGHYRSKLNFTWDGLRAAAVSYRRFIEGALAHRDAGREEGVEPAHRDTEHGDGVEPAYRDAGREEGVEPAHRDAGREEGAGPEYINGIREAFTAAVNDDLNISKALGVAWQAIRNPVKSRAIYDMLLEMDEVFGLGLKAAGAETSIAGEGGEVDSNVDGDSAGDGVGKGNIDSNRTGAAGNTAEQAGAAGNTAGQEGAESDVPVEILELLNERNAARALKDWKKSDELRDIIKSKGYAVLDSKQGPRLERIITY